MPYLSIWERRAQSDTYANYKIATILTYHGQKSR
jgi:hypothetical protein